MKGRIGSYELYLYFIIWIWANFYSLAKLFEAQSDIFSKNVKLQYSLPDLKPGWKVLSRFKDTSDIEWNIWLYFYSRIWYFLIANFIISSVIRKTYSRNILKLWYFVSSAVFIVFQMGLKQLFIFIIQPILHLFIIFCGGQVLSVWLTSIVLLLVYNSERFKYIFWDFLDYELMNDEQVFLALMCIAWTELRCLSFSLDFIQNNENKKQSKNELEIHENGKNEKLYSNVKLTYQDMANMLCYVFYLPIMYTGPIVLYNEFEKSFNVINENVTAKLKHFITDMILFSIYSFILDVSLHYIYFYAMQSDMKALSQLPTIALCGGGLFMGLHFHMKYTITYGTAAAFAQLDNIDTPPTPRCISRIHVYSQMWRYFDVGLYRFLVKYIYKPFNNLVSKNLYFPQMICKLMSSFATFIFIFIWHGISSHIFIWSVLNFIGITLEHLGKAVSSCDKYATFKSLVLRSDAMETRFKAMLSTPLLILSAISNFYLFAETQVGNLFFSCLVNPSLYNSIIICVSMYCCCQASMALEDVPSRTDRGKSNRCYISK